MSASIHDLRLDAIERAQERIRPYIRHTPLLPPPVQHTDLPSSLRLKLENLQVTGSFKVRGAFNTLLQAPPSTRESGVVTASGGNHGVAVAYAAQRLGLPATVYLPATASADRVARVTALHADVMQHGRAWDDAHARALQHAAGGALYVHPFDAEQTLVGQATLGLELLEDVPDLDLVLIAIGGGGLIGGMAAAIKQRRPDVRIIGVEPGGAPAMLRSVEAGRGVNPPEGRTLAGTPAPRAVSERTLALAQRYVDDIVLVDDSAMIAAMRWLWTESNQLVEPAGAAVIAAILDGVAMLGAARAPVALICGGNAAADTVFTSYEQAAATLAQAGR